MRLNIEEGINLIPIEIIKHVKGTILGVVVVKRLKSRDVELIIVN